MDTSVRSITQRYDNDKTRLMDDTITGPPGQISHDQRDVVIVTAKNRGLAIEKISVNGRVVDPFDILKPGEVLNTKHQEEGKR